MASAALGGWGLAGCGVDGLLVKTELGNGFADVVEGAVGVLLFESNAVELGKSDFEAADIQHAVVQVCGESG